MSVKTQEAQPVLERAIVLRATKMTPGTIATNWEDVLAAVVEKSREYQDVTRYNGDEKQAKDDRALLRKQKDMTKTTIASIEEAWNEPLKPFITGARQILKQFDYAIETIDAWVKEGEARVKEEKRQEIQAYFDGKNFDLVPLELFFDDRWLNKGYKLQDIRREIDGKIGEIYGNLKVLESIADHGTIAKALYLDTLDMGAAMLKVQNLKDSAARLAREQVEREARERQAQLERNAAEEQEEAWQADKEDIIHDMAADALDIEDQIPPEDTAPTIYEFTCVFQGTRDQLLKLREYMTSLGVTYEKLSERIL
jgi:hypothetical protein